MRIAVEIGMCTVVDTGIGGCLWDAMTSTPLSVVSPRRRARSPSSTPPSGGTGHDLPRLRRPDLRHPRARRELRDEPGPGDDRPRDPRRDRRADVDGRDPSLDGPVVGRARREPGHHAPSAQPDFGQRPRHRAVESPPDRDGSTQHPARLRRPGGRAGGRLDRRSMARWIERVARRLHGACAGDDVGGDVDPPSLERAQLARALDDPRRRPPPPGPRRLPGRRQGPRRALVARAAEPRAGAARGIDRLRRFDRHGDRRRSPDREPGESERPRVGPVS